MEILYEFLQNYYGAIIVFFVSFFGTFGLGLFLMDRYFNYKIKQRTEEFVQALIEIKKLDDIPPVTNIKTKKKKEVVEKVVVEEPIHLAEKLRREVSGTPEVKVVEKSKPATVIHLGSWLDKKLEEMGDDSDETNNIDRK